MSARGPDNEVIANTCLPQQALMIIDGEREPRLVLGRESLWLRGFPIDVIDDMKGEFLKEPLFTDLAGNMVSTPIFLAMAQSIMAAVSWLPCGQDMANDDVQENQQPAGHAHGDECEEAAAPLASAVAVDGRM